SLSGEFPSGSWRRRRCGSLGCGLDRRYLQLLGCCGVPDDRLAGVGEVEIPPFDRRLRLELATSAARRGEDRRAVTHHFERAACPFEILDDRVADRLTGLGALQRARLIGVALECVGRRGGGRREGFGTELSTTHRIDPADRTLERLVDPGRQLTDA